MTFLGKFKAGGRAAVVALTLGAASVVAMPAPVMAQSFNFDFGIRGGDGNFSFGIGRDGVRLRRECLTNREIVRGLDRRGWDDIEVRGRRGNRVTLTAQWRRDYYRIVVDRCSGDVIDRERLRRRGGGGGRGGVEFEFNFR